MISVVIPTFDRPTHFLVEAIQSAYAQSLPPHEVIVVDNGVTDADRSALPETVRYHRLPPRAGACRARNHGAAVATGTHIAFLDDDDWWEDAYLAEAWDVMRAEDTRCVYGRKDVFEDGEIRRFKCPTPNTLTVPVLLKRNPGVGGQNLLIDRTLFHEIGGFDENLRMADDRAFALELLLAREPISIAEEAVSILRTHDGWRLRDEGLSRLRFVWKYRRLYSLGNFIKTSVRILKQHIKSRLKSARA